MPEHSPEPWRHVQRKHDGTYEEYDIFVDSEGREVVFVGNPDCCDGSYPDLRPEDARRIVACVNFCARIPTETIERLLEQKLGAATALRLLREWAHDDDCLLKPLVEAGRQIE